MKHGVLIDRELIDSIYQVLKCYDEEEMERLGKAISSAPDAVIPISKAPQECKKTCTGDGIYCPYMQKDTVIMPPNYPIITKE